MLKRVKSFLKNRHTTEIMYKEYIKESSKKALMESKEKLLHGKNVFISNDLPMGFDLDHVLRTVEKYVPLHLMRLVDVVYIGDFPFLKKRNINAAYNDEALYITNEQDDEKDMLNDIVHETAHSVEKLYPDEIYSDQSVENEFIGKRKRLCNLLSSEGYRISRSSCRKVEYDKEFDEFLYKTVGYEKLVNITMGLFMSPYAATSLREYFANGFEAYFIGDRAYLKKVSPYLYNKLEQLESLEDMINEY